MKEIPGSVKNHKNRGRSPPLYIEGNPSTAFAARLIPQYESHTRATKKTIQFVVTLTKEIPHSNRVTKKRTPKLSQHVYHHGTVIPYFDSLTRALNQSFPVGENPWCTLVLAPTAVQLVIHGLPLRFLPQDEEELFPYIRQAILNDKATQILSARYLNPSRDSRATKQATSVVITVDPHNVSALTSRVVILSQKR